MCFTEAGTAKFGKGEGEGEGGGGGGRKEAEGGAGGGGGGQDGKGMQSCKLTERGSLHLPGFLGLARVCVPHVGCSDNSAFECDYYYILIMIHLTPSTTTVIIVWP